MRVKLLFVIDNLEFGGGERVFAQIINGLSPEQYEICLASNPGGGLYQSLINKDVCCIPLDFSKRANPALIFKLIKIIKDKKIDIVHGQGARAEFYARITARLAGGTKYVSTIAMPVEGYDVGLFRKAIYFVLDRATDKYVDRFIVVSDVLRNTLITKRHIPTEKVTKIYNGIEIEHYDPERIDASRNEVRHELRLNEKTTIVGAIGRLVWQKGFEYLIRSFPEVLKSCPDAQLLLVGDGSLRANLEVLSESLGMKDKIIFAGFRSDIKEVLAGMDILVIPSLLEGFPVVTLEAMAMAKPIVATDIDGLREQIIDGESGILLPPKDPNALATSIVKLLNDPQLAVRMGSNARKLVEREFPLEKIIMETHEVYQSLMLHR
jgi:glycosyltransferase involved in cell wall biosynthesis